jgi:hypothetical protein
MYKKGKDAKIKGIENLEGMPDMVYYETNKIESIEVFGHLMIVVDDCKKPEGFEGW